MLRLGWFSSARGQTSARLLKAVHDACEKQGLDASIEVVFCDQDPGEGENADRFQDLVRSCGYPLVTLSYQGFRRQRRQPVPKVHEPLPSWRAEYDLEIMDRLKPYPFDLGVLAGYMLVISENMCRRYDLLNLHPSAPGGLVGNWRQVIWQLIAERAKESGVMMHLATPQLDAGQVVTYCSYPIVGPGIDRRWRELEGARVEDLRICQGDNNALFAEIRRRGVARELPLMVATLRSLAQGRIRIARGRATNHDGDPISGFDLTEEVERSVAKS